MQHNSGNENEPTKKIAQNNTLPTIYIIPQIEIENDTTNTALLQKELIKNEPHNKQWLIQGKPEYKQFWVFKTIPVGENNPRNAVIQFHDTWRLNQVVAWCYKEGATAYFVTDDSFFKYNQNYSTSYLNHLDNPSYFNPLDDQNNFFTQKIINLPKVNNQELQTDIPRVTLKILCRNDQLLNAFTISKGITSFKHSLSQITHQIALKTDNTLPEIPKKARYQSKEQHDKTRSDTIKQFLNNTLIKQENLEAINAVFNQINVNPNIYGIDENNQWKNYTPPNFRSKIHNGWAQLVAIKNKIPTSWLSKSFSYLKSLWQQFWIRRR